MDPTLGDREFKSLRSLIYDLTGIALSENKRHLLTSRLMRRLRALKLGSFAEYCARVQSAPEGDPELQQLVNCVTTNKTDFFREPHHFDYVRDKLIPECRAARRFHVWHAGCSSGEEPYTMAITLHEAISDFDAWDIRLLATDIDTKILEDAETGIYDENRIDPVPPALAKKYFQRGVGAMAGRVRVRPLLKDRMQFGQVNLLAPRWDVTGPFDVILCRNVMIYFDKPTQATLIERFSKLLRPGGRLMVGHSESLSGIEAGLVNEGKTIYRKPAEPARRAA
jgi:chemotaxis protein methyltransferase CheR